MVASLQVRVVKAGGPSSHLSVGSNKEQEYMGLLTRAAVPPWNGGVPRRHRKSSLRLGNQVDLQVLHCRVHVAALARVLRPVVKVGCDSTERLAHVRRCPPRASPRGARLCIGVRPGGLKRPAGGGHWRRCSATYYQRVPRGPRSGVRVGVTHANHPSVPPRHPDRRPAGSPRPAGGSRMGGRQTNRFSGVTRVSP